jgi:hypothetical protein
MSEADVDLDVSVPAGLKASLSQLAAETGDSEAELLLKSVSLLVIALRAKRQGKQIVITGDSTAEEITGL